MDVRNRYSSIDYVSAYLQAEWGDILLPQLSRGSPLERPDLSYRDRICALAAPGRFYVEVARQIHSWCAATDLRPRAICDIGGSTGRLVFELHRCLPQRPAETVLVDQSDEFCCWARRLLAAEPWDSWMPAPGGPGRPEFHNVASCFRAEAMKLEGLTVCNVEAEAIPRPPGYFDLVSCINVLDRVPKPRALIERIAELVGPDGLLVLGSPFDFNENFTADKSEWLEDIESALPDGWCPLDIVEFGYVMQFHRHRFPAYLCQVVGARRTDSLPGSRAHK